MIFEFINPSDPYHYEAPDLEVAAAVCVVLGNGKGGARCITDEHISVPIFLFSDPDVWYQKKFGCTLGESFGRLKKDRMQELIASFQSVTIGDIGDYETFWETWDLIADPEKQRKYREMYHDKKRSSLNDFAAYAWSVADHLKKGAAGDGAGSLQKQ